MEIEIRTWSVKEKKYVEAKSTMVVNGGSAVLGVPEGIEAEVFSGAVAKDGKKIFEGDVIAGEINRFEFVGLVKFEHSAFFIENGREKKLMAMLDPKSIRIVGSFRNDPKIVERMTRTPYLPQTDADFDDDDPGFKGRKTSGADEE